uniref:Free fatty acid receptor 4 n=1 Tax=Sparus aurata TaxID=8175 RepID=A0A671YE71_SPAAU
LSSFCALSAPLPRSLVNFTYFSFFSELDSSDHVATTIFETLAITAVFLLSVAANAVAAALVTWERRLPANKTILTLNLFVANLLFVSMIPLIVAVRWTVSWTLGFTACRTVLYVICMSGCVTITTLASISVEREHLHICTLRWSDMTGEIVWNVVFTALCFLLPGFVIVASYSKILQIAKNCRQRLRPRGRQPSVGDSLLYHVSRQDMKLFRTLLVLVLSFLIMWSPIFIITFIILARNFLGHLDVSSTTFFWVITFTLANSALNPILYSERQCICFFLEECLSMNLTELLLIVSICSDFTSGGAVI